MHLQLMCHEKFRWILSFLEGVNEIKECKNVKSVSYAKGPKLPRFRNCSIAESTPDWPAASSHICGDLLFFFSLFCLLLETCRSRF